MSVLLTARQEDALREVANMGSAKAASMLARLVGDVGVLVDVPVVLSANRYQLGWLLGGRDVKVHAATFGIEGELPGQLWWVLKDDDARGHCQQKALLSTGCTQKMLSIPVNYTVTEIKSGCCGMAGSFGYEKEHYDLSMKIGELVLFPAVRSTSGDVILAAPGTSCRHHIEDGTGKVALHPLEVLFSALKS